MSLDKELEMKRVEIGRFKGHLEHLEKQLEKLIVQEKPMAKVPSIEIKIDQTDLDETIAKLEKIITLLEQCNLSVTITNIASFEHTSEP